MANILEKLGYAFVALICAMGVLSFELGRHRNALSRWTEENRFELLESKCRFGGPFLWLPGKQVVYRVRIRDEHGGLRSGWVRFGGWLKDVNDDETHVKWDSE